MLARRAVSPSRASRCPIVVFAFLFGISMDYQVFILSRMRESFDRTGSTDTAVVEGIGRTGRVLRLGYRQFSRPASLEHA
jgi:uncharacterized membrane protein YdfJ with MMPL/SSD domain